MRKFTTLRKIRSTEYKPVSSALIAHPTSSLHLQPNLNRRISSASTVRQIAALWNAPLPRRAPDKPSSPGLSHQLPFNLPGEKGAIRRRGSRVGCAPLGNLNGAGESAGSAGGALICAAGAHTIAPGRVAHVPRPPPRLSIGGVLSRD